MVEFNVTLWVKAGEKGACVYRFSVPRLGVFLAGSRRGNVPQAVCRAVVQGLGSQGFGFWVGCAPGIDRCFRQALSESPYRDRTFVACAFKQRVGSLANYGLFSSLVVPENLPPKATLRRRTLYMAKRCCLAVLFPENPKTGLWGKGSSLVFRSCLYQLKPVFVVCSRPVKESVHYRVLPDKLAGVSGYWVVSHPMKEGACIDDES